jgi:hypothetical protein
VRASSNDIHFLPGKKLCVGKFLINFFFFAHSKMMIFSLRQMIILSFLWNTFVSFFNYTISHMEQNGKKMPQKCLSISLLFYAVTHRLLFQISTSIFCIAKWNNYAKKYLCYYFFLMHKCKTVYACHAQTKLYPFPSLSH